LLKIVLYAFIKFYFEFNDYEGLSVSRLL